MRRGLRGQEGPLQVTACLPELLASGVDLEQLKEMISVPGGFVSSGIEAWQNKLNPRIAFLNGCLIVDSFINDRRLC